MATPQNERVTEYKQKRGTVDNALSRDDRRSPAVRTDRKGKRTSLRRSLRSEERATGKCNLPLQSPPMS